VVEDAEELVLLHVLEVDVLARSLEVGTGLLPDPLRKAQCDRRGGRAAFEPVGEEERLVLGHSAGRAVVDEGDGRHSFEDTLTLVEDVAVDFIDL
jgi:hypothetical protein